MNVDGKVGFGRLGVGELEGLRESRVLLVGMGIALISFTSSRTTPSVSARTGRRTSRLSKWPQARKLEQHVRETQLPRVIADELARRPPRFVRPLPAEPRLAGS